MPDPLRRFLDAISGLCGGVAGARATAGHFESAMWGKKYPKIQLLTVAELLDKRAIEMPPVRQVGATFKKAPKAKPKQGEQQTLDM